MDRPLVSIILPVYNSSDFLDDCLHSLINQVYENIEILAVNDGSLDDSLEKLQQYAAKDSRIRVFHQENQGVSSARNAALDKAEGEYVLFVDSDDYIHPRYLEWLIPEMLEKGAALGGFRLRKIRTDEDMAMSEFAMQSSTPSRFTTIAAEEVEGRFMCRDGNWSMLAIGGKLINKGVIGDTRFRKDMHFGEDSFFLQSIVDKKPTAVLGRKPMYFYRMHQGNAIFKKTKAIDPSHLAAYTEIISSYYQKNEPAKAEFWHSLMFGELVSKYRTACNQNNTELIEYCRTFSRNALDFPFYPLLPKKKRFEHRLLSRSLRLWKLYNSVRQKIKFYSRRIKDSVLKRVQSIGIVTFHCADNFGAMLQTFALKTFLTEDLKLPTEVVNYCPPYMTGRHWLFPYYPGRHPRQLLKDFSRGLKKMCRRLPEHLKKRKNMRNFRKDFIKPYGRKIRFASFLRFIKFDTYVVGSDQIWNPALTYGLRKEYFGQINKNGNTAISYSASFGSEALDPGYTEQFKKYVNQLSAVSMREESSVPYVSDLYEDGSVLHHCDPVFLPHPVTYDALIKTPAFAEKQIPEFFIGQKNFLFVYSAERNPDMMNYAQRLAAAKDLIPVLCSSQKNDGFITDTTAGPSEFLWYIKNAEYVVTNSFHGTAFSIIFHKQFIAFLHTTRGNRITDMLQNVSLSSRIPIVTDSESAGRNPQDFDAIDAAIDWNTVEQNIEKLRYCAAEYLNDNITQFR